MSTTVVIMGAGQIGQAIYQILSGWSKSYNTFLQYKPQLWDVELKGDVTTITDFSIIEASEITRLLQANNASFVINALPFHLNAKVAQAAKDAGCNYIDLTEDDEMSAAVQKIYEGSNLTCATKCGLAPGFINYVGLDLVSKIDKPESLMVSVGALPRHVNYSSPAKNYNLSWSVDGLVNEYIRPCDVRINGKRTTVEPLTGMETILIDGVHYEAAFTSGGVGSLAKELTNIPNVAYKTLRYPGHYNYVRDAVQRHLRQFDPIKKEFLQTFPFNKNDVIVAYAECIGKMNDGTMKREVFAQRFIGGISPWTEKLSAIQATTAGGALAVFELIDKGSLKGCVQHSNVSLEQFQSTLAYTSLYVNGRI